MARIEFKTETHTMSFEIDDDSPYHWCTVSVTSENGTRKLGEESFEIIQEKMIPSLTPPYQTNKSVINGQEIEAFAVVHLWAPLASVLAMPREDTGLMLYLLGPTSANFFPVMELKKEDIARFISLLEKSKLKKPKSKKERV